MKRIPQSLPALLAIFIVLSASHRSLAQTIPISVVTMHAPDPIATESGDTATFEVDRAGSTLSALNVYYDILGTASNGVDYATITHFVEIPVGARSATITIKPIENTIVDGTRTVILQLAPSPLMSPMIPVNYMIGTPSNAVAYIFDDDGSNAAGVVKIISPLDGSAFYAPTNVPIFA